LCCLPIANLAVEDDLIITSDSIIGNLTFLGYGDKCEGLEHFSVTPSALDIGEIAYPCLIFLPDDFVLLDSQNYSLAAQLIAPGTCQLTWECNNCFLLSDTCTLTFNLNEENSYTNEIIWSIATTSGIPDQLSSVNGSIQPDSSSSFRGQLPTIVTIDITQTTYDDQINNINATGFHVEYDSQSLGSEVSPDSFQYADGVSFQYTLVKAETTFTITRYPLLTPATFVSSVLGSLSGIMGGLAFCVGIVESIQKYLDKRENDKKGKEKKPLLFDLPFAPPPMDQDEKKDPTGWMFDRLYTVALNAIDKLNKKRKRSQLRTGTLPQ